MTVKELIAKLQTHNGDMEIYVAQGMDDEDYGYYPVADKVFGLQEEIIGDKTILMICDEFWSLLNAGEI